MQCLSSEQTRFYARVVHKRGIGGYVVVREIDNLTAKHEQVPSSCATSNCSIPALWSPSLSSLTFVFSNLGFAYVACNKVQTFTSFLATTCCVVIRRQGAM